MYFICRSLRSHLWCRDTIHFPEYRLWMSSYIYCWLYAGHRTPIVALTACGWFLFLSVVRWCWWLCFCYSRFWCILLDAFYGCTFVVIGFCYYILLLDTCYVYTFGCYRVAIAVIWILWHSYCCTFGSCRMSVVVPLLLRIGYGGTYMMVIDLARCEPPAGHKGGYWAALCCCYGCTPSWSKLYVDPLPQRCRLVVFVASSPPYWLYPEFRWCWVKCSPRAAFQLFLGNSLFVISS